MMKRSLLEQFTDAAGDFIVNRLLPRVTRSAAGIMPSPSVCRAAVLLPAPRGDLTHRRGRVDCGRPTRSSRRHVRPGRERRTGNF